MTHDFGGLNGLSLEGTPVSRGSLWAFCKQKVLRSAAACDTCIISHILHHSISWSGIITGPQDEQRRYLKWMNTEPHCVTETDEEDSTLLIFRQMLQWAWTYNLGQEKLVSKPNPSMFQHFSYFSDKHGETHKRATAAGTWLQVKKFLEGNWTFGGFDILKDFCILLLQIFPFYLDGEKIFKDNNRSKV